MSQKRKRAEQARARRKRRRHERETDYFDGLFGAAALDMKDALARLEAVGLAEWVGDGWRRTDRSPAEVSEAEALEALEDLERLEAKLDHAEALLGWRYRVAGLPADADESDALAVVRRRAAELEALEQAEAEQAELDHAEAVLGWL